MSSTPKKIRIATRGSKLALWQAEYVSKMLSSKGFEVTLNVIKTTGDRVQDRFLHEMGGKGLFVKELETSMANAETDMAVHSLKDLPAKIPQGFCLGAILKRHIPQDAIIFRQSSFDRFVKHEGPFGLQDFQSMGQATIATSSLRRQSLLKGASKELKLVPVRGNVDTRLAKLEAEKWDALILAGASLERLGLLDLPHRLISSDWFVPCGAQGALAIECPEDSPFRSVLAELSDPETMIAASLERLILERLGGDCTMPFGAFARKNSKGDGTAISALVLNYEGKEARFDMEVSTALAQLDIQATVEKVLQGLQDKGLGLIIKDLEIDPPDLGRLS
ncbi:MAG: hydroxymethylbilane synthase [Oligoflexus sp.]